LADLKNRVVPKIGGSQAGERGAILGKSAKYRLAIFVVGADKEIQILRRSRFGVNAESVAPHHKIPNPVIVEGA
jgi:hypothetical protein